MDYRDEIFRNCEVRLDGNTYISCHFEAVVFQYGGGSISLQDNDIGSFTLAIDGNLAQGLENLRAFAHHGGPKLVKDVVDTISAHLRRHDPIETFVIG